MRRRLLISLLLLLAPAVHAIGLADARHLAGRTGFAAEPAIVAELRPLTYPQAVDRLLAETRTTPLTPAPTWVGQWPLEGRRFKDLSPEQRKALVKELRRRARDLKAWWYREMLATDAPLTEHMTLFWHNHFTSSLRKVRLPTLLYRQNLLLRRYALGNFGTLLHAVARDPAMVLYLDNQTNRKGRPNENFARELLELFTLGEGHYREQDIKNAARAFTGWEANRRTGRFRFNRRVHDDGVKTFMGRTGRFDGDDIIDIVLAQPQTARFVTAKLWRDMVSERPDPAEVRRLAAVFRNHHYEIRPLLRAMLLSPQFRAAADRGRLIKSPVELLVGTLRMFGLAVKPERLVQAGRALGQDLFDPPNVKGWPGGDAWISSATLLVRQQLLSRLVRGMEMGRRGGGTMGGVQAMYAVWAERPDAELDAMLLPVPPVDPPPVSDHGMARVADLVLDPAFQLK